MGGPHTGNSAWHNKPQKSSVAWINMDMEVCLGQVYRSQEVPLPETFQNGMRGRHLESSVEYPNIGLLIS